jgi:hypothetical protein
MRSRCGPLLVALLGLFLGEPARADVIHYKDGRKVEGRILARTATELTVETEFGTIKVALAKVSRIEERATPKEELASRRAALRADDVDGLFELALWARDAGLALERDALLREVLAASPEHQLANELLGRVHVDDRWMDPAEVDAWVASRAEEQGALGLMWDGAGWERIDVVMPRRGFVLWKDAWRPRRLAETELVAEQGAELLGVALTPASGEFVTLFSTLPAEDAAALVALLDGLQRELLALLQPPDEARSAALAYDVPIFLLPAAEHYAAFLDGPLADRYVVALEARERYRERFGFFLDRPRPLIVLHLTGEPDDEAVPLTLRSLLANQLALLGVRRLKAPLPAPGWVQAGVAALLEGKANRHETLTLSSFGVDALGKPADPFVGGWESFEHFAYKLRDAHVQATLPPLDRVLGERVDQLDSRDVGIAWSFVRFLLDRQPVSLAQYTWAYGAQPGSEARKPAELHAEAFELAFDKSIEAVESEWKAWLANQPALFERDDVFR